MSATHRSLARLPDAIFTNLLTNPKVATTATVTATATATDSDGNGDNSGTCNGNGNGSSETVVALELSPSELKQAICKKLLHHNTSTSTSMSTNTNTNTNTNISMSASNNSIIAAASTTGIHNKATTNTTPNTTTTTTTTTSTGTTTVGQLMRLTPTTLLRLLDPLLTIGECQELIARISNHCTPKPKTARYLLEHEHEHEHEYEYGSMHEKQQQNHQNQNHYIPTEVPNLDKILRGGIRYKTITEIVGSAGVGKTQCCMNLAINATALNYSCIYIDTEKKLSLSRLNEIAKEKYFSTFGNNDCDYDYDYGYGYDYDSNEHVGNDDNDNDDGRMVIVEDSKEHFDYRYNNNDDDNNNDNGNDTSHTNKRRKCSSGTTVGNNNNKNKSNNKNNSSHRQRRLKFKPPSNAMKNIMIHSPNSTAELLSVISGLQEDIILRNSGTSNHSQYYNRNLNHNHNQDSTNNHNHHDHYEEEKGMTTSLSTPPSPSSSPIYPVKLIILDSIAAPTRRDYGGSNTNGSSSRSAAEDARDRVTAIFQIAQMLKQIGDELNVAIVVINQIEHQQNVIINNTNSTNDGHRIDSKNKSNNSNVMTTVKAALGTSWHHCVSTRILFEYCNDSNDHNNDHYSDHCITQQPQLDGYYRGNQQHHIALSNSSSTGTCSSLSQQIRKATVIKSNLVGCGSMYYEITRVGFSQWNL